MSSSRLVQVAVVLGMALPALIGCTHRAPAPPASTRAEPLSPGTTNLPESTATESEFASCLWRESACAGGGRTRGDISPEDDQALIDRMKALNVSLNFSEAPIVEVIGWLREFSGLNIVLDTQNVPKDITITFRVDNLPFDQAFDLTLRMWELGYFVRDGVIVVTTRSLLAAETTIELYNVSDLLNVAPDSIVRPILAFPPAEDALPESGDDPETPERVAGEVLVGLIKAKVAKGTWDTPPTDIVLHQDLLIVRHTHQVQRQVQELLQVIRRQPDWIVSLKVQVIEIEERRLENAGLVWRTVSTFPEGLKEARIDSATGAVLGGIIMKCQRASLRTAPPSIACGGQRVSLGVVPHFTWWG